MHRLFVPTLFLILSTRSVWACSVCFGDPSSLMSRGAFWGAAVLVGIVTLVLAAIAWTAFTWSRRARLLEREHGAETSGR